MWSKTCFLITETKGTDNSGDPLESTPTREEVFCSEESVRQSEFYQAMATRLKPEIRLKLHRFEYNNQKKIEYDGKVYDLIRADAKGSEIIEIILGGGINGTS